MVEPGLTKLSVHSGDPALLGPSLWKGRASEPVAMLV